MGPGQNSNKTMPGKPVSRPLAGNPVNKTMPVKPVNPVNNSRPAFTSPIPLPAFEEPVKKSLAGMKLILDYVGYHSSLLPVSADNPLEQLFVSLDLGQEPENENDIPFIQVMFPGDILDSILENPDKRPDTSFLLQFFVPFQGIKVPPEKIMELKEILSIFTNLVPFGYYSFNQNDGVFYRYSFLTPQHDLDDVLTVEIVQMIQFFMAQFFPKINNFCNGNSTFEQIIEEIEKDLAAPQDFQK